MNHIDRILAAFAHKEPDKVPKGEFVIDKHLIPSLARNTSGDPFQDTLTALRLLNVDLTGVESTETRSPETLLVAKTDNGRPIVRDIWGAAYIAPDVGTLPSSILESPLKTPEDIYAYAFPPLNSFDGAVADVRRWVESTDYFVVPNIWSPFSSGLTELMGWENYMMWTVTNRRELARLSENYAAYQAEVAKRYLEAGAHGILIAGDLAGNSGPFLNPELIRELILPQIRLEIQTIKGFRNVPIIYHSDGNITSLVADLINIGIDGLNPIEPHAGMDLAAMKKKYGEKLCLLGNVDTSYLLPRCTPEQIRAEVRRIIEIASPGGGFILQTANMLTPDIPIENVLAMFVAAEDFGRTRRS